MSELFEGRMIKQPRRFRIYAREKGKGRFKPLDLKNGRYVVNLIYASILDEPYAQEQFEYMKANNPELDIDLREIK